MLLCITKHRPLLKRAVGGRVGLFVDIYLKICDQQQSLRIAKANIFAEFIRSFTGINSFAPWIR